MRKPILGHHTPVYFFTRAFHSKDYTKKKGGLYLKMKKIISRIEGNYYLELGRIISRIEEGYI